MTPSPIPIIQMANITKTFPNGVVANDDISLTVWEGTVHAVIGENGAGKSTLMHILYGRYQPDRGRIRLRGEDVRIESPAQAISLGLGMVSQHTTLIPALSVLDNIILGNEYAAFGILNRAGAARRIETLAKQLGVELPLHARTETLSVAAMQKAEIMKALYRGAKILILDEPTATLAPQEADALFRLLASLKSSGTTILFITHKLREVMQHTDAVTVLRGGRAVGERITRETYPEELLALMLGQRTAGPSVPLSEEAAASAPYAGIYRETEPLETADPTVHPLPWERGPQSEMLGRPPKSEHVAELAASLPSAPPPIPLLEIRELLVLNRRRSPAVQDFDLQVSAGEIVGIAGVDGSGQKQLAEAVIGLSPIERGQVLLDGSVLNGLSVERRLQMGISYIPEDRHREGLILDFTIAENLLLGRQRDRRFGGGWILDLKRLAQLGDRVVQEYRIRAGGGDTVAGTLSGGNQQKVVIARAMEGHPRLVIAMQPTRGLDVGATEYVYDTFRDARTKGVSILLFSLDLDEIFALSDRIAVMYNGRLAGVLPRAQATMEEVGRLMVNG
jgi:simple sugar transport system ATP-binding protein